MKKRNSFAILTIAGAAVLSLASCESAQPEPKPDPGHQHTYSELHAKVEPTCLSEGVEAYYSCTGCDLLFNENKEVISQPEAIPALPHTPHHHDATDPSCTEPGTGEYWTCDNTGDDKLYGDKDCKEVIQSIPVVDPTGHDLSQMPGNPSTCKEAGWKEYYKCDDCDALFEDAEGKTSITDLEAWKKGAGKLDLAPHSAQFVAGQASTCKEHGWKDYYHCGGCDGYFEDQAATKPIENLASWKEGAGKLDLAAHTPVKQDGKAPTCTSDGWKDYYKCSVCDRLFEDEACKTEITDLASWKLNAGKLPMGEHSHTLVSGKPSTCKEQGYKDAYYCEGCKQYFEDAGAKTLIGDADAYEAWKVAGGQLPFAAHKPVKQDGKASSCTENGWADYYKCSVCDRMFEEEACKTEITNLDAWKVGRGQLPLLGHETSLIEGQEATCEEDGWEDYYQCSECKGYFEDEAGETPIADLAAWKIGDGKIPAKGHDKDLTKTEKVEPTCYQTGVKEYYQCESCEQYFEDADAKTKITDLAAWKAGAGLIPATGEHDIDYANAEVVWSGDMATASASCLTEGCTHKASETKQGSYVKDTDATCTAPEKGHYEVTFNNTNFGSARTAANSVDNGEPHAHTYGDLVPQVDAHRETAGKKAYYKCSECNGYFDSDKNAVSESSLVIPAPAKEFENGKDLTIKFDSPIATTETIYFDIKFTSNLEEQKIDFALLGAKDGGKDDWDNYLGYFRVFEKSVENNAGISADTITDDGYLRVKVDLNAISKVSGTKPSAVSAFYLRGKWSVGAGYVEINSNVDAHTKGSELIPAKATVPHSTASGYQAHYECTGCDDYWFNESGALCKKEDLIIASKVIKYAPPTSGDTMAEFKNLGNITDKLWIDIHFDNPTVHQELGFNFYESAWDNYYGTFWVDCDAKGVYFEGDYSGLELAELEDGWWRVTAYPSALSNFRQDKTDIAQKRSIDFVWIKGPGTVKNRGSGMLEFMPDYNDVIKSTKVYSLSGKNSFTTARTFLPGSIINLDINIKNNKQAQIDLMTGWDPVCRFKVNPNGTLVDQKEGIQVFRLNNELEGYPTLEGTWYRIVINTNNITPMTAGYPSIMRIGGNNWNEAEFDMMIDSPYTTDGWYTFNGGSTNTQINVKSPNIAEFRDAEGQLIEGKVFQLKVKGEGSGKAKFSLMEHNSWKNCGNLTLTFENSVLTDAIIQGGANKWPTRTDLGDGVYLLTFRLDQLPGDGFAQAKTIGFFYGDGVLADGLTSFSINLLDVGMADAA